MSEDRWHDLNLILRRTSPLAGDSFVIDTKDEPEGLNFLRNDSKFLCVGAGGLGCDILKCLALSGFKNGDVIDMDIVDATNLNRQFLFRETDVGQSKSLRASAFINKRVYESNVTSFNGAMQEKDKEWYEQFNIIICGLDSVPARRWINSTLFSMLGYDEEGNIELDTVIPMIDSGTEGFEGQVTVIYPGNTACIECNVQLFVKTDTVAVCTLAGKPRKPEHCILYAGVVAFPEKQKGKEPEKYGPPFTDNKGTPLTKWDSDEPEHMKWLWETAQAHAKRFELDTNAVTFKLTKTVLKNTMPAIASTNALVAAIAVHEAFKLCTGSAPALSNYVRWNGKRGIFTSNQKFVKNDKCTVCGKASYTFPVSGDITLAKFFDLLKADLRFQFQAPTASCGGGSEILYIGKPAMLEKAYRPNLEKPLNQLIKDGETLHITDTSLAYGSVQLIIKF